MTQKYRADGTVIPVTKIHVDPCVVVQVKTAAKDGYSAVQVGTGKKKSLHKAQAGHMQGMDFGSGFLQEFRVSEEDEKNFKKGDIISTSVFIPGEKVRLTGISKGRGFQGVVKRHRFHGSPKSRGHKDQLRMPGASGAGGYQHVLRGKKMPGRMGGKQVTFRNVEIIEIDNTQSDMYIKGAVPGARNSRVWISM